MEGKNAEGEECMRKAGKYLKTSLLKWKPDYDSAAAEYDRAAVCYKNAKNMEKCLEAYLKGAECHEQNGVLFHAARDKEQAALVCKDMKRIEEAKKYMEAAASMYAETGTPDTSAMALDKAAKFLEPIDPLMALAVYQKALAIVEGHPDKTRMAGEFTSRISKIHLKMEQYDKAAVSIADEIRMYANVGEAGKVGKLTSGLVLVQLVRGDSVAAHKAYQKACAAPNFGATEDAQILPPLIDAYEKNEEERFERFINHPHMKSLDNEYMRLMKKIKLEWTDGMESGPWMSMDDSAELASFGRQLGALLTTFQSLQPEERTRAASMMRDVVGRMRDMVKYQLCSDAMGTLTTLAECMIQEAYGSVDSQPGTCGQSDNADVLTNALYATLEAVNGCEAEPSHPSTFKCGQCDYVAAHRQNLHRHQRLHRLKQQPGQDARPFACSVCSRRFATKWAVKEHCEYKHAQQPAQAQQFNCEYCGKTFAFRNGLRRHVESVHLGERRWMCSQCDKAFANGYHLRRHVDTVHMALRPHQCSRCDKAFSTVYHLSRHQNSQH